MTIEKAVLAAGCFWCIEAPMQELKGVKQVLSGYMGGGIPNPSYQQICSGSTGHAEVIEVTFDNEVISYEDILAVFFALHDPTQLNRQGNDVGSQYRSAIFYADQLQLTKAQQYIGISYRENSQKIVTTLEPLQTFYIAEDVHQNYYQNNPYQPYCQIMIAPKMAKLAHLFTDKLK